MPRRPEARETDTSARQESSSFLKKRTKKLLLPWLTRLIRPVRTEENKSFLVLFFKKELLPSHLPCLVCQTQRPGKIFVHCTINRLMSDPLLLM
jgi:hypothetical protein